MIHLIGQEGPVFCTMCRTHVESKTACYSCGCDVCSPEETVAWSCSAKVTYLGRKRLLCANCIEMRADESPALAAVAKAFGEPAWCPKCSLWSSDLSFMKHHKNHREGPDAGR